MGAYERLLGTNGDYIADCLVELREGSAILREKFGEVTESEKKISEDGAADSGAKAAQVGDAGDSQLRFGLFTPTELPKLPFENPFADAERFAASPVSQWVSIDSKKKSLLARIFSRESSKAKLDLSKLLPLQKKRSKLSMTIFAQNP